MSCLADPKETRLWAAAFRRAGSMSTRGSSIIMKPSESLQEICCHGHPQGESQRVLGAGGKQIPADARALAVRKRPRKRAVHFHPQDGGRPSWRRSAFRARSACRRRSRRRSSPSRLRATASMRSRASPRRSSSRNASSASFTWPASSSADSSGALSTRAFLSP